MTIPEYDKECDCDFCKAEREEREAERQRLRGCGAKPGSEKARKQGCTCPVLDNLEGGELLGLYWMDLKCPVHGREGAMRRLSE